jgi:GT2 family glycosyltransferase
VVTEARETRSEHPPDLTVVIVTYNSSECLARCLRSVADHLPGAQVLVVDNGSADASVAIARGFAPQVEIIEVGANVGFGRACNLGAQRAAGTQLLFLNPDVKIVSARPESLAALAQTVPYGLVVPLLAGDPGVQPAHQLYRLRHWLALEFRQLWAPLLPREWQRPRRVVEDPARAWAQAAMLLARRDEFLELGGFDERYFLYSEDLDLCRRYRTRGLEFRTTAALAGIHVGGASSSAVAGSPGVPAGWALLGLLEYVARWYGEVSAIRAARIMLATFRLQIGSLSLAAAAGSTRAQRKLPEIKSVDRFLRAEAIASRHEPPATANCWRAARAAVRRAAGSGPLRHGDSREGCRANDGQEQG